MKRTTTIFIILIQLLALNETYSQNYSSKDKIIKIQAEKKLKHFGKEISQSGMYKYGMSYYSNVFPRTKGVPDSLKLNSIYSQAIDDAQAIHQSYKFKKINKGFYKNMEEAFGFDFKKCSDKFIRTYLQIAIVTSPNNKKHYIIDSNMNWDFSDDKIFDFEYNGSHKIIYESYIDNHKKKDSTLFNLNYINNQLFISVKEHTEANFYINDNPYQIKIVSNYLGSQYPKIFFFDKKNNLEKEYEINNLIKIDTHYYRISNISKDYKTFDLIKTKINNGSNQLNFNAFPFKAKDVNNNIINFPKKFKNQYVLINFWNLSCRYLVNEMNLIAEESIKLSSIDNLETIGVANDSKKLITKFIKDNNITGIQIQANGLGNDLIKKYALGGTPQYFLISPDGIIIHKGKYLSSEIIIDALNKHANN